MVYKDQIGLVEWCRQKQAIGAGYVYGTYFAKIITEAYIQVKAAQYPNLYTAGYIERSRKWIGKEAGDCVGLIKGYYWYDPALNKVVYRLGGRPDTSANGMRSAARNMNGKTATENKNITWGYISTIPEKAGVLVWKDGHIGVYVGNGNVIESRGVDYGVVETKLSGRPWVEWCVCPFITYKAEGYGDPMLFKGCPDGEAVKEWQQSLMKLNIHMINNSGQEVYDDGDFGTGTENGTNIFKESVGLPKDGIVDEITYGRMLDKLQAMATGITQSMLDSETMRADLAEAEVVRLTETVDAMDKELSDKELVITQQTQEMSALALSLDNIEAFRQIH